MYLHRITSFRTLSDYLASNAIADSSAYTFLLYMQIGAIWHGLDTHECPTTEMRFIAIFTGMLYLEAGINGRYFALTKNVAFWSCVCLYEEKVI